MGAGSSAAEATARSGQGSKRKGLLREARLRVEGDHVEGDKVVVMSGGERGVTLRTLSPATVEAARHTFREPPRWPDIQANAWQHRSMVLRGPDGSGKTAAAVRLLLSDPEMTSWYLLDSVADLARLTELDELGSGAALLLSRPRDFAELRGPLLEGLEGLLDEACARLVLTVGTDVPLDRGLGEYVLALPGPPELELVLDAHLVRLVEDRGAAEVMAVAGMKELVAELLQQAGGCRDAARLAAVLAHEYTVGALDPEHIRTRMDQHGGEDPETWFEGLSDPVLCTQAVALAALNGLPQEEVSLAATSLLGRFTDDRMLLTAANTGSAPAARNPFANSRRAQLDRLRARTVTTVARGQYGRLPCTIAEYRDGDYPRRVLRHVWSEYQIQPELVDWLGELVDSASEQVRSFAGTALGLIATDAFDHLGTQVFPRWIHDETHGTLRREAVAYALRVCVEDPALRPGVRAMVEGWYLAPSWQAKAAAARAYGLCLGGGDLQTAVDALARLGTVDHIRVAIAIGDSFADLLEENVERNAEIVLAAIERMVDEDRSRASGHLAFLIIADALVTEELPRTPGAAARSWPTLLRMDVGRPGLRGQLIRLWAEVVNGELFGDEAAEVLAGWAGRAERDPLLLADLQQLLQDLADRDERTRRLLLHYAARWAAPESLRPLSRTARVVSAVLGR